MQHHTYVLELLKKHYPVLGRELNMCQSWLLCVCILIAGWGTGCANGHYNCSSSSTYDQGHCGGGAGGTTFGGPKSVGVVLLLLVTWLLCQESARGWKSAHNLLESFGNLFCSWPACIQSQCVPEHTTPPSRKEEGRSWTLTSSWTRGDLSQFISHGHRNSQTTN